MQIEEYLLHVVLVILWSKTKYKMGFGLVIVFFMWLQFPGLQHLQKGFINKHLSSLQMRSCNMITWQLVLHKLSRLTTLYLMPNDWRTVQVQLSLYLSLLASCGLSFLHYCNLCDGKLLPIEVLMLFEHGLLILDSVLAASVDRERLILQGLGFIYSVFFFFWVTYALISCLL
jgi:hypothetical protein